MARIMRFGSGMNALGGRVMSGHISNFFRVYPIKVRSSSPTSKLLVNHSSSLRTLADLESPVAVCYLHRADDERHRAWLTAKHLVVVFRGRKHVFALEHIKNITFEQRRAWLPLILGGIVAPFSLVAILLNLYNPWVLIYVFLPALLLLYLGWLPYTVLAVHDAVKPHDFRLPTVSSNLQAFVRFANRMALSGDNHIYHVARAQEWEAAQAQSTYAPATLPDDGFIHASQADQLARLQRSGLFGSDTEWVVLTVDPLKVQAEVRYEPGDDPPGVTSPPGELFPHIYGPLNLDAVVGVRAL